MVDAEALQDHFFAVVVALHERIARHVVLAFDLGRVVLDVIRTAAHGVDAATRHAFDDFGVGHADFEHEVKRNAGVEERLGLRDRAGEAVEEEALFAVGLREAFLDEADDDVVRHELTRVHHLLGGETEGRARLDGGAKHVARGDLGNAELFGDELGLGALAGTGRPDKNETHGSRSVVRVVVRKIRRTVKKRAPKRLDENCSLFGAGKRRRSDQGSDRNLLCGAKSRTADAQSQAASAPLARYIARTRSRSASVSTPAGRAASSVRTPIS